MRQWSSAEIEKALRDKKEHGISFKQTAERLGVSYATLRTQIHNYRYGKLSSRYRDQRAERLAVVEPMLERGAGLKDFARAFGLKYTAASEFLRRCGYDAEVRRLYREGEGA